MAKTIMVVDDSASIRMVVGIALRGAGYEVIEAKDGKDALAHLTGQKVHLIISDVNMPVMDGISFVKAVKQHPSYRFTRCGFGARTHHWQCPSCKEWGTVKPLLNYAVV